MKWITFLMALLVLALSVLPCADEAVAGKGDPHQAEWTRAGQHDINHEDRCSPFCTCACCAAYSLFQSAAAPALPPPAVRPAYAALPAAALLHLALPIWQPPQLG
ncbi:DUF6660 family protein [Paraflavisolibacter sp. H34]|uniref:DUF6660 family protein n=1 Tax=Huijunlia imazamoxiresistens TaxID=3127457 RepID=UPI003019836B